MLSTAAHSASPSGGASNGSPGATADGGQQKSNDNNSTSSNNNNNNNNNSSSTKEPRTKRKKARRACFSCQRAHLTCGDERPCNRCIQRNLTDSCQDGVRKKAKYLNDEDSPAPMSNPPNHHASAMRQVIPQQNAGQQTTHYDMDPSIPGTMEDKHPMHINPQQRPDLYDNDHATGWFAPLAPDMGIAFNSNYARGEFASINHITAGQLPGSAGGTGGVRTPDNHSVSGFSPSQQNFMALGHNDCMMDHWAAQSRSNSTGAGMGGNPHAYTIGTGPGSIATPSPEAGSPQAHSQQASFFNTLTGSPGNNNGAAFYRKHQHAPQQQLEQENRQKGLTQYSQLQHHPHNIHGHTPHFHTGHTRRRNPQADPSQVYHTVTEPYSYVQAYHRLFAIMEIRFPKKEQLRIARAFSAFRPSFIASIQKLTRDDLVFQEKCCQRAIHIFESSLPNIGTPTLVCRRSGEVVVVGKEFCMLSGWPKEVLLGEKPNLNTNIPHAKDDEEAARVGRIRQRLHTQFSNGNSRGGNDDSKDGDEAANSLDRGSSRPKPTGPNPVFLLELMDDESVCEFYEKFSQAAFADSTAKITSKCRILKYRPLAPAPVPAPAPPNENVESDVEDEVKDAGVKQRTNGNVNKTNGKRPNDILGSSKTIECMVCWTLRRDTFDIPMLIVMNFLPNLLATSSTHPTAASSSSIRESENSNKNQRGSGNGSSHPSGMPGNNNSPLMKLGGSELVPVR
ncbi:hypothetical protein EV426DRAFT_250062 [Tirmania nivea]|nr:hypothetical protein EV426DRAFT_250062 [Tirmania nivea]